MMIFIFALCILIGMLHGYIEVRYTKMGIRPGVPHSQSLIDFIFFNR